MLNKVDFSWHFHVSVLWHCSQSLSINKQQYDCQYLKNSQWIICTPTVHEDEVLLFCECTFHTSLGWAGHIEAWYYTEGIGKWPPPNRNHKVHLYIHVCIQYVCTVQSMCWHMYSICTCMYTYVQVCVHKIVVICMTYIQYSIFTRCFKWSAMLLHSTSEFVFKLINHTN